MTSVLRELQAEWNSMVPAAQAAGIRRVRILGGGDVSRGPLETIAYRRAKVEWLRALLGTSSPSAIAATGGVFDFTTFGVELECVLPRGTSHSSAAHRLTALGVPCQYVGYNHHTPAAMTWKIVTDGSIGDYTHGAEFVSGPLRGDAGFAQLKKVCDYLTGIGARINRRCGLHVHVGVASEGVQFFKNLVALYTSAERALDSVMPDSRRGSENGFCQPVRVNRSAMATASNVADVTRAIGQIPTSARDATRYCKLNYKSFFAYGTVEFRHHAGTVDAAKAANWVKLCLRMVLAARAGETTVSSLAELMDAVDATPEERQYFASREALFRRAITANHFTTYGSQTTPRGGHQTHQGVR